MKRFKLITFILQTIGGSCIGMSSVMLLAAMLPPDLFVVPLNINVPVYLFVLLFGIFTIGFQWVMQYLHFLHVDMDYWVQDEKFLKSDIEDETKEEM